MSDTNERLNQLLIDQIEKFDGATDKAVDFVVEQTPDLIQQLLMWHGVKSGLVCATLMAFLVVSCLAYVRFWKSREGRYDANLDRGLIGLVFASCFFLALVLIFENLDWLQILIAPKLYLLEYAAGLVT